MKKTIFLILFLLCLLHPITMSSQVVVQQQQNINNIQLPVIEKKVYVDRYRVIYKDRPAPKRTPRKLPAPVRLVGYLWVYPFDLGEFNQPPVNVISQINSQSQYGRNDWRVPTTEELAVMEANWEEIGLGEDIYMATDHRNGVLRLVSTGPSVEEQTNPYSVIRNKFDIDVIIKKLSYTELMNFSPPTGYRKASFEEICRIKDYLPKLITSLERAPGYTMILPRDMFKDFYSRSYYMGYESCWVLELSNILILSLSGKLEFTPIELPKKLELISNIYNREDAERFAFNVSVNIARLVPLVAHRWYRYRTLTDFSVAHRWYRTLHHLGGCMSSTVCSALMVPPVALLWYRSRI